MKKKKKEDDDDDDEREIEKKERADLVGRLSSHKGKEIKKRAPKEGKRRRFYLVTLVMGVQPRGRGLFFGAFKFEKLVQLHRFILPHTPAHTYDFQQKQTHTKAETRCQLYSVSVGCGTRQLSTTRTKRFFWPGKKSQRILR